MALRPADANSASNRSGSAPSRWPRTFALTSARAGLSILAPDNATSEISRNPSVARFCV